MNPQPAIRGLGCLSCLGEGVADHLDAVRSGRSGLLPLRMLHQHLPDVRGGWIEPRARLSDRRWSPASVAALQVAAQAIEDAGWDIDDLADVPVFAAGSRGGLAGWLDPWPGRRPLPLMAASNSIASEPAAALCHRYHIRAPWHFSASGCCAGIDAMLDAALHLTAGRATRAIVVAVDLPLVQPLLDAFTATGMLGDHDIPGMHPAEAAAAVCMDLDPAPAVRLTDCLQGTDSGALFGGNRPLPVLHSLLSGLLARNPAPDVCIPHASGTSLHEKHESAVLADLLNSGTILHPLKPLTGHALGASSLLETVIAAALLREADKPSSTLKIASALGGRHSLALLSSPS